MRKLPVGVLQPSPYSNKSCDSPLISAPALLAEEHPVHMHFPQWSLEMNEGAAHATSVFSLSQVHERTIYNDVHSYHCNQIKVRV